MAVSAPDPFAALGAIPEEEFAAKDPFAAIGAVPERDYAEELAAKDDFDPVGFALDNPEEKELAKEVAWRKKQRPFTAADAAKIPGQVGSAAVGIVKDFGAGVGNIASDLKTQITDETPANVERAATQQMARAQLAEHHAGGFLSKLLGKDGWLGPLIRRLDTAGAMAEGGIEPGLAADYAETKRAEEIDRQNNPRKYFDLDFERRIEDARKDRELSQGKVSNEGFIGGLVAASGVKPTEVFQTPEELAAQGAPIDEESIRTGAVAADPTNVIPLQIPKIAPVVNKVAGGALRGVGKVISAPAELAEATVGKRGIGRALKTGAGIGLGIEAFQDPESAVKAGGALIALKGLKKVGHLIDTSGAKLLDPKMVTKAERAAGQELIDINARGGSKFFNRKLNKADLERAATKTIQTSTVAPLGMLPITAAVSETPEEAAAMTGGALGFGVLGGVTGYNPAKGFSRENIRAVSTLLAESGAQKKYGTEADAKHDAWMEQAPDNIRETVNSFRGFFDGFKIEGKEPELYVLDGNDFAQQVVKHRPDVSPELARQQRGFATKDGKVYVNGEYGGDAGGILGHEAGGHIAQTITEHLAPQLFEQMIQTATKGLYENGKPTKKLIDFVAAYNRAFDPSGKTQEIDSSEQAITEWLAENARAVLQGQGPAKFAAGESVRQSIADNLGDYFRDIFGTKKTFDRAEIPAISQAMRDMLFELSGLKGMESQPEASAETPPQPEGPTRTTEPVDTVAQPADPFEARVTNAGLSTEIVDAARDLHVGDPAQVSPQRASSKKGIAGKSREQIIGEREAEWDTMLSSFLSKLEQTGADAPKNPTEFHQAVIANFLSEGAGAPKGVSQALSTVQPAKTSATAQSGALSDFPARQQTPETTREAQPQGRPDEYTALADEAAADIQSTPEFTRKRSQSSRDSAVKTARTSAILDAVSEEANQAGDKETLQRRIDDRGRVRFTGTLDRTKPAHQALAKELGLTETDIDKIEQFQSGKTLYVDYLSAKNLLPEDISGKQRKSEYAANPPSERGDATGTLQRNKAILGVTLAVTPGGGAVLKGISVDKYITNAKKLLDFAASKKIETGYKDINDPQLIADLNGYVENHRNGYKGNGSGPVADATPTEGYIPHKIPSPRFDLLNAAFQADVSTKVDSKRKDTRQGAMDAQFRAMENDWPVDDATGDVNPFRAFVNESGELTETNVKGEKRTGTKEILEEVWENLSPDMIQAIKDAPDGERSIVREVGFTGDPAKAFAKGAPNFKNIQSGFMPADRVEKDPEGTFWHGSPSGDLRGGKNGLHVGTKRAAQEALEARIGIPAEGEWDGTREYGKTLLAGQKTIKERYGNNRLTGHNSKAPQNDYYPSDHSEIPAYGDQTPVAMDAKPVIMRVRIKGEMTNSERAPLEDFKANAVMKGQLKKGNAKRGYFYKNEGEDSGSISAVVPSQEHIERFMPGGELSDVEPKKLSSFKTKMENELSDVTPKGVEYQGKNAAGHEFKDLETGGNFTIKGEPSAEAISAKAEAVRKSFKDKPTVTEANLDEFLKSQGFMPSPEPEAVKSAAVMDADGRIFEGTYHGDAIDRALSRGGKKIKGYSDPSWDVAFKVGFVDNKGDFLTREEAFEIGKKLKQLPDDFEGYGDDPDGVVHTRDFKNTGDFMPDLPWSSYLDYGHDKDSEAWIFKSGDVRKKKVFNKFGDSDLHGDNHRALAKGRIDHNKKVITVVGTDNKSMEEARKILKSDYPDYGLINFMPGNDLDDLGFYSQLKRVAEQKITGKVTADQLRATLKNNGVKNEELDWVLGDLLNRKKGEKITPEELRAEIEANRVELKEVEKGAEQPREAPDVREDQFTWTERIAENDRRGRHFDDDTILYFGRHPEDDSEFVITPVREDEKRYLAHDDTEYMLRGDWGDPFEASSIEDAKSIAVEYVRRNLEERMEEDILTGEASEGNTKFSQYQLPGGENYRELLYQLPRKSEILKLTIRQIGEDGGIQKGMWELVDQHGDTRAASPNKEYIEQQKREWEQFSPTAFKKDQPHFTSSHFDEPNIIFHARVNDRSTADGDSMLFAEEVQSDWHQLGRKKGYENKSGWTAIENIKKPGPQTWQVRNPDGEVVGSYAGNSADEAIGYAVKQHSVPDAPFKGEGWKRLAIKNLIRKAIQEGKDRIGWTTGEQQAERYDLSKQLDSVEASPWRGPAGMTQSSGYMEGYMITARDKSKNVVIEKPFTLKELPDAVGKELAQKIIDDLPEGTKSHHESGLRNSKTYSGLDLKVGGEGMKGFYDKELVNLANDIGKKYGSRVEKIKIPDESAVSTYVGDKGVEVWSLPITDKMKEAVSGGQAMFMPGEPSTAGATKAERKEAREAWLKQKTESPFFKRWFSDSKVVDDEGKPLVVYSGHSNAHLYGNQYKPRVGSAGGYYASESPEIASQYALGKMGGKNQWRQNGDEYRFKGAGGKFVKKIWQTPDLTPDQQQKVRDFFADEETGGVFDVEKYWEENAPFDETARRAKLRGGLRRIENIHSFMESMGDTVAYPISQEGKMQDATLAERQQQNRFEDLLDHLGIEWDSLDWMRPGVFPVYLRIRKPLDASEPFPKDLLEALKQASKRKRNPTIEAEMNTQWTSDYPLKSWVKDIEGGDPNWSVHVPHDAVPILRQFGYDGFKELGLKGEPDRAKRQINWIAFDPDQIKSATGNIGTFDPKNPDIRFMPGKKLSSFKTKMQIRRQRIDNPRAGRKITVYRNTLGEFIPKPGKQSLANVPVGAVASERKKGPLADFK